MTTQQTIKEIRQEQEEKLASAISQMGNKKGQESLVAELKEQIRKLKEKLALEPSNCETCLAKEEKILSLRVEMNKRSEDLRQEKKQNGLLIEQFEELRLKEELRLSAASVKQRTNLSKAKSTTTDVNKEEYLTVLSKENTRDPEYKREKKREILGRKISSGEPRREKSENPFLLHFRNEETQGDLTTPLALNSVCQMPR